MSGSFGALDWGVVGALLLITTWIGHRAAGRQESLRDFFLGGRRLPWYAVAASIVATEISAVTFISLPSTALLPPTLCSAALTLLCSPASRERSRCPGGLTT